MTFEVSSVQFIHAEVDKAERIDMYAVLFANGMYLILEGFLNGYPVTETAVDSLYYLIHGRIEDRSVLGYRIFKAYLEIEGYQNGLIPTEAAVDRLNTLFHIDLITRVN